MVIFYIYYVKYNIIKQVLGTVTHAYNLSTPFLGVGRQLSHLLSTQAFWNSYCSSG